MQISDPLSFGLCHFLWALPVSFFATLAMASVNTAGRRATLHFYSESLLIILLHGNIMRFMIMHVYANLTFSEMGQLGLFFVLAALVFIHYLKMYMDFRSIRAVTRLRFFVELLGFVLLLSTFVGAWSMVLICYFHISAYKAQHARNGRL
jgi:hypothetical protein